MSNWAFVDVETDGLIAGPNKLMEIAVIVTDENLNVLDEDGYHAVIKYDHRVAGRMRARAVPIVQEMHEKTGLWQAISEPGAKPLKQVDIQLTNYLEGFGDAGTMPVAGNSVRLDMNFIDEFLPEVSFQLDYHMRDISTLAGIAADWYGLPRFEKFSDHTAMKDVRECIREAKHYRHGIFYDGILYDRNREEEVSETNE
jgi:oligoribonuclease